MMSPTVPDALPAHDPAFWPIVAAILLLLALSAFFSGAETALGAASRSKLRARADKGDQRAADALEARENSENLNGAILVGNNLVKLLATSLAAALGLRI